MRLKVLKANTELGGKNVKTKCGIFVNGDMDPWHTFSITTPQEAGQCNRAVLIEGENYFIASVYMISKNLCSKMVRHNVIIIHYP